MADRTGGPGPWGGTGGNNQPTGIWPSAGGNNQPTGIWPSAGGNNQPTGIWPSAGGNNQPTGIWPSAGGNNQPTGFWPGQPGAPAQNPIWQGEESSGGQGWPEPLPGSGPSPGLGPGPAVDPPKMTVPFSQCLTDGVYDKLLITITGCIKPDPNKIVVDLNSGKDVAFHFNPRFNEGGKKVIVRNSRIGGQWGREERETPCIPFFTGQPFEIKILCTNHEFKISVNNSYLLDYKYRIKDLSSIQMLNIYGDLTLSKVNMKTQR